VLSVIGAGGSRSETVEIGGLGLQTVRDWVVAFKLEWTHDALSLTVKV
jgi:hypothetical protein